MMVVRVGVVEDGILTAQAAMPELEETERNAAVVLEVSLHAFLHLRRSGQRKHAVVRATV